jgi:hypothetical protein
VSFENGKNENHQDCDALDSVHSVRLTALVHADNLQTD